MTTSTGGSGRHTLAPADLLDGRYRLGELLGVGGTASVFAAEDLGRDRPDAADPVAIKVAHPHLSTDDVAREVFLGQARAVAALRHPNIPAVRGTGVHDAGGVLLAWVATDLVPGATLAEWVAEHGPLAPDEAVRVADGVLRALAAVHELGVVHRDVSPGNVLLAGPSATDGAARACADAGQVRLLDFGIADAPGRPAVASGSAVEGGHGSVEAVVGSVHYMSPEQAQGLPVDARGDVYQVGALLYFALTGQPPYPRATARQVMQAHVSAPPPAPSAVAAGVPRALDRLIARAMSKDPDRRFGSAAELAQTLRDAIGPGETDGVPRVTAQAPAVPSGAGRPGAVVTEATARALVGDPATVAGISDAPAGAPLGGFAAVAAALVLAALLWIWSPWDPDGFGVGDASSPTAVPPRVSPTATVDPATASPDPDPDQVEPEPVPVAVPEITGGLEDARRVLELAGLMPGQVVEVQSPEPAGTVLATDPVAGTVVEPGSTVHLTVASGLNTVPDVVDLPDAEAAVVVTEAGFVVARQFVTASDAAVGMAQGTRPAAGAVQPVGSTVWLVVGQEASPSPTPSPTPSPSPSPSSSPTPGPSPTTTPSPTPTGTPPATEP